MKRPMFLVCCTFILCNFLHAQDLFSYLASYQQVAYYGFADSAGNTKTGGKYNLIMRPVEGICKVWAGQRSGYDYNGIKNGYCFTDGRELVPPQFDRAEDFSDGLALVANGDYSRGYKYGFINKQGLFQIPLKYAKGKSFSQGLAAVSVDDKQWQYIDKGGAVKIAGPFLDAEMFSEGLACVSIPYDMGNGVKSFKRGYIDLTGNMVIEPEYIHGTAFKDGFAIVTVSGTASNAYRSYQILIDRKGKHITSQDFVSIQPGYEGVWAVKTRGTAGLNKEKDEWGIIDNKGTLYPPRFPQQPMVREGLIAFEKDSLWGFMDKQGKTVIKPVYKRANGFMEGLAVYKHLTNYGVLLIRKVKW
ncbi:WG repeat-containing protein [Terrimonas sp. NA20]|uniref:WG repeat-containing protein n=1 Tax=Terrimonas ginsenosidimutans TaxID=2908004 RepID=A0ABS9KRB3_9BACT|nr:WG repeat-containing protein [Terrimonas ginsenosidimutans]MCG2614861.1 WG repeat-containing protein [Terrimonas ginsenosidimutans]